jgi:predicted nucleotidyltransferase
MHMKPSDALRKHRSEIRNIVARHGALAPRVFGSAIHGTDTEESDLDVLVDPSPRTTLMTLAAIQLDMEHLLGVRVEVLTPNSIPQQFRNGVLVEAIPV